MNNFFYWIFAVILGASLEQLTVNLKIETSFIVPLALSLFCFAYPQVRFYKDRKAIKALKTFVKEMEKNVT